MGKIHSRNLGSILLLRFFLVFFKLDIIFAVNELTHPGEKRMISYAKGHAKILPKNFEENMNGLLNSMGSTTEDVERNLKNIIENLKEILS